MTAGSVLRRFPCRFVVLAAAVTSLSSATSAQAPPAADRFARVTPLIGRWAGTSEGRPGKGTVEREYAWALGQRYVRVTNRSHYPAQPANPKGETHEDEGFISVDSARGALVLRQFHIEGFVNQYVAEAGSDTRLVFTSEAIENIPTGWRARETFVFTSADTFDEVFELAEPGKDFEVYTRATLRRAR